MPSSHPSSEEDSDSLPGSSGSISDPQPLDLVSQQIRNAIAVVITAMWAVGIIADALSTAFELSPFVYATMMGLAASIFGANFVKGIKG